MSDGLIRIKGATFPVNPNPPAGRYYIGVDASDGHWKKQDSTGAVTDYDSGASYSNEDAQDAVGGILTDTPSVNMTYNDASNQISADVIPAGVNHDALANFAANRHIDHSAVNINTNPGSGLTGGGDISASRVLSVVPSEINHNALQNFAANRHIDHSAVNINTNPGSGLTGGGDIGASRALSVVPSEINHNALQNYVADQHIPHSSININTPATGGLKGGGNIAANRTLELDVLNLPEKSRIQFNDLAVIYDVNGAAHKKMRADRLNFVNPDRYRFIQNDFISEAFGGLTAAISGTGASAQPGNFGVDLTEQAQGVVQIDTGTTALGRVFLGTAAVNNLWTALGNILRFGARVVPELLSNGTDAFVAHVGFCDNNAIAGEPIDGAYFRYNDAVNGGRWEAVVAAGGTRQSFDTGVLAQQQYQILEVEIDYIGANPIVRYFIDGNLVNTINTPSPIPTGPAQAYGYAIRIEKTIGLTQRNFSMDWFYFELDRNGAR